jgi:hypothetical protein
VVLEGLVVAVDVLEDVLVAVVVRVMRGVTVCLAEFENEGEDPTLIFSVFAIGSSVCAQLHEVKKEKYLEHCGNFYDDATEFLTDMEVLGDKDES